MKYFLIILFFTLVISSNGQTCKNLPNSFYTYNQAITKIKSSSFVFTDFLLPESSSWIESAKYFSCDKQVGYLIYATLSGKEYIHHNVPMNIWLSFKNASSKGSYYVKNIKGKYKLILSR
jgi:hypothetical protein